MTDTLTRPVDTDESWTAREIRQQPETLAATFAGIERDRAAIEAFVAPLVADRATRIVLTGAGTSAFIGEALAPELSRRLNRCVEAIATTDLVSAPHLHLRADAPTLLVSFGRSGSSPESVAAVDLADRLVSRAHHLIVTCNPDGELARRGGANTHVVLLPDATHDRSFAMTSSFTAMTLAARAILGGIGAVGAQVPAIVAATRSALAAEPQAAKLAARGFERVVYLGSGVFKGLAREAALKLMELSDGAVVTAFDTPMGFRHGPKTIVTDRTLVVAFASTDPLTRRYDRDVVDELRGDGIAEVVVIGTSESADLSIDAAALTDADLLFPFIVPAQLFALHVSLARGLTPDRPNATGTVNRVVKGVRIHA
jgi:tagatose-6-phosphate ketose/aldose isomerase